MVLQGDEEGFSPPFDSSLFGASQSPQTPGSEFEIEYEGCEALAAFFTLEGDYESLLPEGVVPFSQTPQGGVFVTHYPFSTVGEYYEYLTVIQVEDLNGEMGYYIPYIYVTNDAAMAAGRELAGAPKKIADINLDTDADVVNGTVNRPEDKRLLTVTTKPEQRATGGILDAILPTPTPLLSIRHLPPIRGGDGLTQLVEWYADIDYHTDEDGRRKVWSGPGSVTYDSNSAVDPIHKVGFGEMRTALYLQFDMTLGATDVQQEWDL